MQNYFLNLFNQVSFGNFWMALFGAPTPKGHVLYSNDKEIVESIVEEAGSLPVAKRRKLCNQAGYQPLVTSYIDDNGLKRHCGTQHLRGSQFRPYDLQSVVRVCLNCICFSNLPYDS